MCLRFATKAMEEERRKAMEEEKGEERYNEDVPIEEMRKRNMSILVRFLKILFETIKFF